MVSECIYGMLFWHIHEFENVFSIIFGQLEEVFDCCGPQFKVIGHTVGVDPIG